MTAPKHVVDWYAVFRVALFLGVAAFWAWFFTSLPGWAVALTKWFGSVLRALGWA